MQEQFYKGSFGGDVLPVILERASNQNFKIDTRKLFPPQTVTPANAAVDQDCIEGYSQLSICSVPTETSSFRCFYDLLDTLTLSFNVITS